MPVPNPPTGPDTQPPRPDRNTGQSSYGQTMNNWVAWFSTFWVYLVDLVPWITSRANETEAWANQASASANAAASSLTSAQASASTASTQATNAAGSATAAATSAASAVAAYDSFDDRYLGPKATAPTFDNDGSALVQGALYFNTSPIGSGGGMKVWNGTAWIDAYGSITSGVSSFNSRTGAVTLANSDVLNIDAGFPAIRPSFLADFAAVDLLDPRFGFSRASTGTFFDANGVLRTAAAGVPRLDHDPLTGAGLGLLVEPAATNLLTFSRDFTNAAWERGTGNTLVTADASAAIDGTMTEDKLIAGTTNGTQLLRRLTGATTGVHTFSFVAKAAELSMVGISVSEGAQSYNVPDHWFSTVNLLTGAVTQSVNRPISASAERLSGGRYIISGAANLTGAEDQALYIGLFNGGGTSIFAGDGTSGIFIADSQLEPGVVSTSRTPTDAAQVTRAADSAAITGANFSSWFRQDEGTVFVDFVPRVVDGSTGFVFGEGSNRFTLEAGDAYQSAVIVGGNVTYLPDAGSPIAGQPLRLALTYSAAGFALSMNGGVPVSAAIAIPVVNQLEFVGNMTVRRATFYPRRLTNGQLQALTAI